MILEDKFLYITPFHKGLHSLVTDMSRCDIGTFKSCLVSLRVATVDIDLTRIVEPYLDPWWMSASLEISNPDLFPDVPRFRNVVCYIRFHRIPERYDSPLITGGATCQ
jgi:hypothetical protein